MVTPYYSLLVQYDNGVWRLQCSDYDVSAVRDEMNNLIEADDVRELAMQIVVTWDTDLQTEKEVPCGEPITVSIVNLPR